MAIIYRCCPKLKLWRLLGLRGVLGWSKFQAYPPPSELDPRGAYRRQAKTEAITTPNYSGAKTVAYHVDETYCGTEEEYPELVREDDELQGNYDDALAEYESLVGTYGESYLGRTDEETERTESYGVFSGVTQLASRTVTWTRNNPWDLQDLREELALELTGYDIETLEPTPQEEEEYPPDSGLIYPRATTYWQIWYGCGTPLEPTGITHTWHSYDLVAGYLPITANDVLSSATYWPTEMRAFVASGGDMLCNYTLSALRTRLRFAGFGDLREQNDPCLGTRLCFTYQTKDFGDDDWSEHQCESGWSQFFNSRVFDLNPCIPADSWKATLRRAWLSRWHEEPHTPWPNQLPEAPSICEDSINCPANPDAPACDEENALP